MQEQLGEEMKKASAAQEYERAAQLRDLLADLRHTTKKVSHFERMPYTLPLALDAEKDLTELGKVLGLAAPPQRIEGFDISNISGTFKVASLVSFRNGRPDRANYRRFKIKTVEGQDDFASVAEVVRRRYTRVMKESKVQSPKSKVPEETASGEKPKEEENASESSIPHSALRTPHSALRNSPQRPVVQQQQYQGQRHQRRLAHQPQGEEEEGKKIEDGRWKMEDRPRTTDHGPRTSCFRLWTWDFRL
jgi:hypothetical protein